MTAINLENEIGVPYLTVRFVLEAERRMLSSSWRRQAIS